MVALPERVQRAGGGIVSPARRKCRVSGRTFHRTPVRVDWDSRQKALSDAEVAKVMVIVDPMHGGFEFPDAIDHTTCVNCGEQLGAWHSRNRFGRYCEACTVLPYHVIGRPERFATQAEVEAFIDRLDRGWES
jgi:hypothetical protein